MRLSPATPGSGLLLAVALLLVPVPAARGEGPVRVVASIPPLAMLAGELGGRRVEARSLLPAGADPHVFEPRPSDAAAVASCDVYVLLGSDIDDWLGDAVAPRAGAQVLRLDPGAAHATGHAHSHAHGDSHPHSGADDERAAAMADPHVWLDPIWVRDVALRALHRGLVAADPAGAATYGVAARSMSEKLTELDEDIRRILATAPTRTVLPWHPAWTRFAWRYGLRLAADFDGGHAREPSGRAMIAAVREGREAGVRAVLVELQGEDRQAAVLAAELGVPQVGVDPLGDPRSLHRSTYRDLMLFNAEAFAKALGAEDDEEDEDGSRSSDAPPAATAASCVNRAPNSGVCR